MYMYIYGLYPINPTDLSTSMSIKISDHIAASSILYTCISLPLFHPLRYLPFVFVLLLIVANLLSMWANSRANTQANRGFDGLPVIALNICIEAPAIERSGLAGTISICILCNDLAIPIPIPIRLRCRSINQPTMTFTLTMTQGGGWWFCGWNGESPSTGASSGRGLSQSRLQSPDRDPISHFKGRTRDWAIASNLTRKHCRFLYSLLLLSNIYVHLLKLAHRSINIGICLCNPKVRVFIQQVVYTKGEHVHM